ncbi:putative monooxygenase moxC [Glarea lozoyensis 74030]|uniref:Putative monooxygenase moxC n=1 Tax=Glarea lozoyensis (strain ATCC 74030 / MF5533) TaxID=1104152 RepID=H0EQ58_GLAL7|nr:putative monooxygenase moxC [Glarea lozoyensis 74030]
MAAVSNSVGFGITGSTSYLTRYEEASEFMDLVYTLWQGSWEDDAKIWSVEKGAYDPEKIHKITFNGKYHKTFAHAATHPSPQRVPLLFQAGQSSSGKAFAGKHAEAVFCGGAVPSDTAPYVKSIREIAASNGRNPDDIKVFPQMTPILGRTLEEAQAKKEHWRSLADWRGGMAKLSSFINIDLFTYPLDEPFKFSGAKSDNAIHAIINTLQRYDNDPIPMTPRRLGATMAFCGFAAMPVGTPEMVADVMEDWVNNADIDGFNVTYVSNPQSFEDVVELLVPVLQERGLMWEDYTVPGGTLRENMYGVPGQKTPLDTHPSSRFRYGELLETNGDGKGGIVIDRINEKVEAEVVDEKIVRLETKVVELNV